MSLSKENILLVADIIAEELPAEITDDWRTGSSDAQKQMHDTYVNVRRVHGIREPEHIARREWIRELLTKHLVGDP